jgi:hypothetical protein
MVRSNMLALCAALLCPLGSAGAFDIVGRASVIDGDGYTASAFAFWGIDAPVTVTACYGASALNSLLPFRLSALSP